MGLEVSLREVGDTTIIDLAGDLVGPESGDLHSLVKELLQTGKHRLSVNLKKVQRIDEHGLGRLSACHVSALRESSRLNLLSPTSEVREALQRTRLERFIEIYDTEEDLLAGSVSRSRNPVRTARVYVLLLTRGVTCAVLWVFLALVLVVLWMQVSHPAVLDRLAWLVLFEGLLLSPIRAISDQPTPVFFYLILLYFGGMLLLIFIDSHLYWLRRVIEGKTRSG